MSDCPDITVSAALVTDSRVDRAAPILTSIVDLKNNVLFAPIPCIDGNVITFEDPIDFDGSGYPLAVVMVPSTVDVKSSSMVVAITSVDGNAITLETPVDFDASGNEKDSPKVNPLAAAGYDPPASTIPGNANDLVGRYSEDNDDHDDDDDDDDDHCIDGGGAAAGVDNGNDKEKTVEVGGGEEVGSTFPFVSSYDTVPERPDVVVCAALVTDD